MHLNIFDAIVIGAGIGGLVCGTRLAQSGARVVICEAMPYVGGYMSTYTRRGFRFACGPLSFSSPEQVQTILRNLGLAGAVKFQRSHFRQLTPTMDLTISQPFDDLATSLQRLYPGEKLGIQNFFGEVRRLTAAMKRMEDWEPRLLIGADKTAAEKRLALDHADYLACLRDYADCSSRALAKKFVRMPALVNLLSQSESASHSMPALLAANMWDILCEKGIWYPQCGIQGITDLLVKRFLELGGELRLGQPVSRIVCQRDHAEKVRLCNGEELSARVVVSNADYKHTCLQMIEGAELPAEFVQCISQAEVTGSDLCVSIGARLTEQDLANIQTHHVLYRGFQPHRQETNGGAPDFWSNRDMEICVWSLLDSSLAPPGMSVVLLRCRAPYEHFSRWRTEGRRRKPGYRDYKLRLARDFISAAVSVIPNLSKKARVMDVATPLTYEYYTGNHKGAVAGWSWSAQATLTPTPEFIGCFPIQGLYAVGHWVFTVPFLGAVPTAMHSGELVARAILCGN